MKKLVIDGYNLLHKHPSLSSNIHKNLSQLREKLIAYVHDWKKYSSFKGSICIVFDGKGELQSKQNVSGITVVYTHTMQEADNYIVTMLSQADKPFDIIVVSDDNFIANNARSFGAIIQSTSFILNSSSRSKQSGVRAGKHKTHGEKNISVQDKQSITSYLKKIWNIN